MRALLGIAVLACAACSDDSSDDDLLEEQAIAAVEAVNEMEPPVEEVTPEPLLQADIERNDILGARCTYTPGTNLGTRVISREADAFMKIDGDVRRFAADPGSRELPRRTRSLYNGREFTLRLELEDADGPDAAEDGQYEGTVHLLDRWGREVYTGSGAARCVG